MTHAGVRRGATVGGAALLMAGGAGAATFGLSLAEPILMGIVVSFVALGWGSPPPVWPVETWLPTFAWVGVGAGVMVGGWALLLHALAPATPARDEAAQDDLAVFEQLAGSREGDTG